MNIMKLNYEMKRFDEQNVEYLLKELELDLNNYFIAMMKPGLLSMLLGGSIVGFYNRYCIVSFSEAELNLVMLSRMDTKKVTEVVKINRNEINNIKLSNILISYMLKISFYDSKMHFQVFKKFARFSKIKNSIQLFQNMYIM